MKTKACALLLAIVMLFSFVCTAENSYLTVSDPYYTDGTNVYDLSGLSCDISVSLGEALMQLIVRAVTTEGTVSGIVEMEDETVSLFADDFSAVYQMTKNDFGEMAKEAVDHSALSDEKIDSLFKNAGGQNTFKGLSLKAIVSAVYDGIYGDASQLENAKTGFVSTFLHSGMNAFVVPIEVTAEETDRFFTEFCMKVDEKNLMSDEIFAFLTGEENTGAMTAVDLYERNTKPLNLNVKGNVYYGENDIFIELNLLHGDQVVLPAYMEVTNTDDPILYINMQLDDESVLYATIETTANGKNDFLEIGALDNERTVALVTYQMYDDSGIPVKDLYLGFADGNALYNVSFINKTDKETMRMIFLSAYLDGIEMQLSYNGAISNDYGDKNEQGRIQLATNIGIQAHADIGFGTGSGSQETAIPSDTEVINVSSMTEEESQRMMLDFRNFTSKVMSTLVMGVPGIARLVGMEEAEG